MQEKKLPKTYKGYSTKELLKTWSQLKSGGIPEDTPKEQILAMSQLLQEYKISPESRA